MKKITTRFPPSPTGYFHVGSARTALFNFLYAKSNGGEMRLRFEDTDKERNKTEFEESILEGLSWLGIEYDGKIEKQSERKEIYKKYISKMLEKGSAYEAEDAKDGSGKVIRFKNPNKEIMFEDEIRGEIRFDTTELEDFVIAKNIEEPLYHLAVVIDDLEMNVTHVIRGEDHISNTPRQILLQEAIGAPRPVYAHLPLILAADRSKMSKRHGAVSVSEYRDMGYLPEALINYLALLGWNPGDDREVFSIDELIKEFSIKRIQKGGAIFNIEKLNSINSHYLKKLSREDFVEKILQGIPDSISSMELFTEDKFYLAVQFIQERVSNGKDAQEAIKNGDLDLFFRKPKVKPKDLIWKDSTSASAKKHLNAIIEILEHIQDNDFNKESTKSLVWPYAEKEGRGEVLWPMRYALSGKEKSPDPFAIADILGKKESIARLKSALETL